jgi:hypothetical protein
MRAGDFVEACGSPGMTEADQIARAEDCLLNAAALFEGAADRAKDSALSAIICAGQEKLSEALKAIAAHIDGREAAACANLSS